MARNQTDVYVEIIDGIRRHGLVGEMSEKTHRSDELISGIGALVSRNQFDAKYTVVTMPHGPDNGADAIVFGIEYPRREGRLELSKFPQVVVQYESADGNEVYATLVLNLRKDLVEEVKTSKLGESKIPSLSSIKGKNIDEGIQELIHQLQVVYLTPK